MRRKLSKTEIARRKRAGAYHDGAQPLSAKRIQRLKGAGRYHDALIPGLYLQISKTNARSWLLRFEIDGRERWQGLGSAKVFTLAEARARARAARQLLADGIDPLARKQEVRAAAKLAAAKKLTFADAAERYLTQHSPKWRNASHGKQWLATLQAYAFPTLGAMDVAVIDTADILRALEPSWTTKAVTADRVRSRIEAVLDWAVVRGHRQPGTNPAKWRGHLDQVLPAARKLAPVAHHPAMSYRELPAFIASLEQSVVGQALRFLILTSARSSEVLDAHWREIDFDNALWTVPAAHMKGGREHRVPLAPAALELLKALPREGANAFIFVGSQTGRGLAHTSFTLLRKRMGVGVTTHGFRSSFRDWAGEQTNFPREICEAALAHTTGNAAEQAYARSDLLDRRRRMMEQWAKFCMTPVRAKGDVVVPIGGV